jgi:hypothetical protein
VSETRIIRGPEKLAARAEPRPSLGLSLRELWKPYVYRGLGSDIFNPDEEEDDDA